MTNGSIEKNIFEMTDAELRSISDLRGSRSIFYQFIQNLKSDLEILQLYFTDMTDRSAVLLTVASLLTFLPVSDPVILRHFLIWVFPLLLAGVVFFVLSSIRIHATRESFNVAVEGTPDELIVLRLEVFALQDILKRTKVLFGKNILYYRLMLICLSMYLADFILHYYVYIFYQVPGLYISSFFTILVLDLGLWWYLIFIKKSISLSFNSPK